MILLPEAPQGCRRGRRCREHQSERSITWLCATVGAASPRGASAAWDRPSKVDLSQCACVSPCCLLKQCAGSRLPSWRSAVASPGQTPDPSGWAFSRLHPMLPPKGRREAQDRGLGRPHDKWIRPEADLKIEIIRRHAADPGASLPFSRTCCPSVTPLGLAR